MERDAQQRWSTGRTGPKDLFVTPHCGPVSEIGSYAQWVFSSVVAVVAVAISLLIPAQLAGVPGCDDVHVIGVRGSGQRNYGDQVGSVVAEATKNIGQTGRTVAQHALDYPAISISDSFGLVLLNGEYDRSVRAGVKSLTSELDAIREECPLTQIILVGYSQGSQVIKTAMVNRPLVDRIASVVLLADPTRETSQRGVVRLGSQDEGSGAFGLIMLPEYLRTVAIDVCAVGDGVCGRGGFLSHIDGYEDFAEPIVRYVLSELAASPLRFLRPS
jgi:pimeloyl-ACP methyl ester carboxylesterase